MFNDDWMIAKGYLPPKVMKTVGDILEQSPSTGLITVRVDQTVEEAYNVFIKNDLNQLPVVDAENKIVGSLSDSILFSKIVDDPSVKQRQVGTVMSDPFPNVPLSMSIDDVSCLISKQTSAVISQDMTGATRILNKYDIINALR
eukprot:TRINITY_DN6726_c0_g1_i2.p1 TRINITY_DN6726_c0_g1~~TRINITY_DN6726_c0_g1_i2.p1  ORF type:complete len:144 (-),score=22.68 TRINITY_DN6726_c0_g1_i2:160-591(-)